MSFNEYFDHVAEGDQDKAAEIIIALKKSDPTQQETAFKKAISKDTDWWRSLFPKHITRGLAFFTEMEADYTSRQSARIEKTP